MATASAISFQTASLANARSAATPALQRHNRRNLPMPKFSDLLDRKSEDIKQPPLLPAGLYLAMVEKYPEVSELRSDKGQFERLTFAMKIISPHEVDEDAIAEFGTVQGYPIRHDFIINNGEDADAARGREGTLNRIKAFLTDLGAFSEGMTLQEGLVSSVSASCLIEVGHRPDPNDSERFYTEVKKTYAA
jgi:hypothetical protein